LRKLYGITQQCCGHEELVLVFRAIGNVAEKNTLVFKHGAHIGTHQLAGRPADDRKETGCVAACPIGESLQPSFHFCPGGIQRIEIGTVGFRRHAGDKRHIMIQTRPRSLVDQKIMQARTSQRALLFHKLQQESFVARPNLAKKQGIHNLPGLDQFRECLFFQGRQAGYIRTDFDRGKPGDHLPKPGNIRHRCFLG